MSDLEQSDIENMSDDEGSSSEIENLPAPTFTRSVNPNTQEPINNVVDQVSRINDEYEEEDEEDEAEEKEKDDDEEEEEEDDEDASVVISEDEADDDDMNDDISIDEETGNIINKKTRPSVKKTSRTVTELPITTLNIPGRV
jgi:AAA ATPase containing von Willebrand factor type A (vWA) domain